MQHSWNDYRKKNNTTKGKEREVANSNGPGKKKIKEGMERMATETQIIHKQ